MIVKNNHTHKRTCQILSELKFVFYLLTIFCKMVNKLNSSDLSFFFLMEAVSHNLFFFNFNFVTLSLFNKSIMSALGRRIHKIFKGLFTCPVLSQSDLLWSLFARRHVPPFINNKKAPSPPKPKYRFSEKLPDIIIFCLTHPQSCISRSH